MVKTFFGIVGTLGFSFLALTARSISLALFFVVLALVVSMVTGVIRK